MTAAAAYVVKIKEWHSLGLVEKLARRERVSTQ
jgi:hypothetical protein